MAPENYDLLLEHEARLDGLTLRRLGQELPEATRAIQGALHDKSPHALHATTIGWLYFQAGPDGETFAARWAQAGFPELKNDERVILRGKMQVRVALLEIQRVRDDGQSMDAVDLLDPSGPLLRFVDRSVARRAVRFSRVLTWIYPLPHFWRMFGTGVVLPVERRLYVEVGAN